METLKKLIKQATTQIDRERENFANSLGVTGVQMSVIDFLSNHQNNLASQNEVEHEFNIKRSTTTIMLQRMEKRGLIVRVDDPKDKRKKQAQLTESALKIVPKIRQYMKQDNEEVLDNLSMKDVNTITAFLRSIKEGKAND
ncbi:MarR family winged helix-turn-helix transcriptional regulator [Lactobacillus paragasseri]|uniref:MarR family transcriptional regulator n=1 Tax=Lactobacillus paragasseri TaxID=2107999 RepID=A0ABD5A278_9LACO|nr:MarR family transcriptional regulator [Lactobacillus paragasseri]MDK7953254.1 MarR family transcriptional regulator [Lactobacillus paragasseri]MDO6361878.1 MarR family transcriptional regulator [Lactobacillus paragasseri]MDX5060208.1 MarR family transcriptional regulator [Lactobacillus paragasseri]